MATPEGRVKAKLKELLKLRGSKLKQFWPVQNGMGAATIDCHICYCGRYIVVETKAPGEEATPRQASTLEDYDLAGAASFVIDGDFDALEGLLDLIRNTFDN